MIVRILYFTHVLMLLWEFFSLFFFLFSSFSFFLISGCCCWSFSVRLVTIRIHFLTIFVVIFCCSWECEVARDLLVIVFILFIYFVKKQEHAQRQNYNFTIAIYHKMYVMYSYSPYAAMPCALIVQWVSRQARIFN